MYTYTFTYIIYLSPLTVYLRNPCPRSRTLSHPLSLSLSLARSLARSHPLALFRFFYSHTHKSDTRAPFSRSITPPSPLITGTYYLIFITLGSPPKKENSEIGATMGGNVNIETQNGGKSRRAHEGRGGL